MRILLVEDDPELGDGLTVGLRQAGFAVDWLRDGHAADLALRDESFDLVVLDLGLPRMSGMEVLKRARDRGQSLPILILTARDATGDKVSGLDAGADDYMIKPFDISEFEARVRMLLRRQAGLRSSAITYGGVALDLNSRTFSAEGTPLDIPARELGLLEILFMRAGKVVAKEAIMQSLAAFDDDLSANAIEQYVSRLRKRLAPHGLTVRTARGIGYYLDKASAA